MPINESTAIRQFKAKSLTSKYEIPQEVTFFGSR